MYDARVEIAILMCLGVWMVSYTLNSDVVEVFMHVFENTSALHSSLSQHSIFARYINLRYLLILHEIAIKHRNPLQQKAVCNIC